MADPGKKYVIPPAPAKGTTTLSYAQLRAIWIQAGGDPALASTMAAVALAESGGRVGALNDNAKTGDYSVGLWQVNYFGDMRSGRTRAYGTPEKLRADALANARAAVAIYSGQGLNAWSTFTSGAYKAFFRPQTPQEKVADQQAVDAAKLQSPSYINTAEQLSLEKASTLQSLKLQQHFNDPWITITKNSSGKVTGFGESTGINPPKNVYLIGGKPATKSLFQGQWSQYDSIYEAYTGVKASAAQQAEIISRGISRYVLQNELAAKPGFTSSPIYRANGPGVANLVKTTLGKPADPSFVKRAISEGWDQATLEANIQKLPGYTAGPVYKAKSSVFTSEYEKVYGAIPPETKGHPDGAHAWIHDAVMNGWTADEAAAALRADPAYRYSPEYQSHAVEFLNGMGLLVGASPTLTPTKGKVKNPSGFSVAPLTPGLTKPAPVSTGPLPTPQRA